MKTSSDQPLHFHFVKLGNHHILIGNQLFIPARSGEFSLGTAAAPSVQGEQKFQRKPFRNIPAMACFGWIAPVNLLQAGREDLLEQGGCGRALEQGEALESLGGFGDSAFWGGVWREKRLFHGSSWIWKILKPTGRDAN